MTSTAGAAVTVPVVGQPFSEYIARVDDSAKSLIISDWIRNVSGRQFHRARVFPAIITEHKQKRSLHVGVSHSIDYVGYFLHIHIVIMQSLWGCLGASFN